MVVDRDFVKNLTSEKKNQHLSYYYASLQYLLDLRPLPPTFKNMRWVRKGGKTIKNHSLIPSSLAQEKEGVKCTDIITWVWMYTKYLINMAPSCTQTCSFIYHTLLHVHVNTHAYTGTETYGMLLFLNANKYILC